MSEVHAAGFTLWAESGRIMVEPASRLSPELRERIKANRTAILAELSPAWPEAFADELDELRHLARHWHALRGDPPKETAKTLSQLRRIALAQVPRELADWRRLVADEEAKRCG
jgi:hypothetical protein